MMPTRDKLLYDTAESDLVVNACRAYATDCGSIYEIVDEIMQALLASLPDTTELNGADILKRASVIMNYYHQLIGMKK